MSEMKILLITAKKGSVSLLAKILSDLQYEYKLIYNQEEAIDEMMDASIDVCFLDEALLDDNYEFVFKIREVDNAVKTIVFEGSGNTGRMIGCINAGINGYLLKSFSKNELLNVLDNINIRYEEQLQEPVSSDLVSNILSSKSNSMQNVIRLAKRVAPTKATVLINGETGTGKGQLAQVLHELSPCRRKPFIKVNCAAIPETLLESELFGYEKGAFTGAVREKPGRFELADESTIFLDEIGDISPVIQVKLLRVLQEKEFERLGGVETLKSDVRIITATNKNLQEMVREGKFREDLYYRLNVVPVVMPPLRERKEDISDLVMKFLEQFAYHTNGKAKKIEGNSINKLLKYNWPGNIRELENVIENCVVISEGSSIRLNDLPVAIRDYGKAENYKDIDLGRLDNAVELTEKNAVMEVLQEYSGNKVLAAKKLGISVRSLQRKVAKYAQEK